MNERMENVEIKIVILKSRLSDQKNLEKSSMKIIWNIDQNINLYEFPFLNFVEFVSTSKKIQFPKIMNVILMKNFSFNPRRKNILLFNQPFLYIARTFEFLETKDCLRRKINFFIRF
jgi:hypothetical protein